MNQDISICVLTENEMGWTEPFELDKVQILDNYYLSAQKSDIAFLKKMDTARLLSGFRTTAGIDTKGVRRMADGKIVCLAVIVSAIILRLLHRR